MSGLGTGADDNAGDGTGAGFWAYSLALYGRPGVAEACLALQDRFGADVNLLLLGFWRAHRGFIGWAPGELDRAQAAAAPVNAVLQPLRQARRALKALQADEPAAVKLYEDAKALELQLEQVAQAWLAAASRFSPASRNTGCDEIEAAAAHLAAYLERLAPNDQDAMQLGADLLRAAFTTT